MPNKITMLSVVTVAIFSVMPLTYALSQTPDQATAPTPATHLRITPKPGTKIGVSPPDYDNGLKAMDEGRWSDALKSFDKLAAENPEYADGALFWKAYNLSKLGRKEEAGATCRSLQATYPRSTWIAECATLRVDSHESSKRFFNLQMDDLAQQNLERNVDREIDEAQADADLAEADGDHVHVHINPRIEIHKSVIDPNDDLKLLALNSLMQQEPEKALPVLRILLNSDKPLELRRRAIFVLAESKSPEARQLLMEIAMKNSDPGLQRSAVQTLGTKGKDATPQLVKIYKESNDNGVKRAAVSGLFIAGDATDLVDLSRSEKDMEMKRNIVSQLAVMHDPAATAYMEELLK
jgi:hypothetical protein